jgi:hypothetical protein
MTNGRTHLKRALRKPAKAIVARLGDRSTVTLLRTSERLRIGAEERARLLAHLGRREHQARRDDIAVDYLAEALSLRPDELLWTRDLLEAAATAGDRTIFYTHLTPQVRNDLDPAKLASLLAQLASSCKQARDFRAAADAYHHAYVTHRETKGLYGRYMKMRELAPDWGFYASDPQRSWDLSDYPDASTHGLVAPISKRSIFGWLPATASDTTVYIKLNGTVIAETRATTPTTLPDGRSYFQFSRKLLHLWSYAGAGDLLTIESNSHDLAIIGRSTKSYQFRRGESSAATLVARLSDGFVFTKSGRVMLSIRTDDSWQNGIFELYTRLRQELKAGLGITLIPFYGTLLGAVREHDFIRHDNDFDCIYLSEHSEPDKVRHEFTELCKFLLSRGFELYVMATHTHAKFAGSPYKLDIFFGWFTADGYFDLSYGYHGEPVRKSAHFFEYRTEQLGDFEIPAPENSEEILSQLYGATWRTPDAGFAHRAATRKIDRDYHLTTGEITELHWSQFYRDHEPARASRFAMFVADQFDSTGTLVEFGCGTGRDGIYFANRGWMTLCCDRSAEAIGRADNVVQASGGLPARFQVVDADSASEVQAFLDAHTDDAADPLVVYLRFFLHAIDEDAQNTLLDTLTSALTREFYLCAEFRTLEDRKLAKHHGTHYRRYIDHHELAEQLRDRWGFDLEHVEAGQGLSPYDGEDPYLGRVIAFRPAVQAR